MIESIYRTREEWIERYQIGPYSENLELQDYDKSRPVAKCRNGLFVGNMENDVAVWKGIPYAKAPEGELRFKRAQDPEDSDKVYDASYYGLSCLQPDSAEETSSTYGQGEDCLRLNLWANTTCKDTNKPILVFIHGGGWASGGTADPLHDGYNFVYYNPEMIFVTINYRFNVMGLVNLSSFPDGAEYETSVNNGLYDQAQALKWLHDNAEAFGGDPNNITIAGESAGGGSVSALCLMEDARKYFQKAIPMSGSVSQPNEMSKTYALPEALKKDFGAKTVADLQKIPFDELKSWWTENQNAVYHLCVRDGKALSEDPFADWCRGVTKDLVIMQGHTTNEFQYYQHLFGDNAALYDAICDCVLESQRESGSDEFKKNLDDYSKALLALGYTEDDIKREYMSDRSLAIGNTYQATAHADNGGKGYFYLFDQPYDGVMAQYGAAHAVDLCYFFGNFDGDRGDGTKEEVELSRRFQRMITNFCLNGDPSCDGLTWPAYDRENRYTMIIGPNMRVEKNPEKERVEAALKMIDTHPKFRYLESFASVFPMVAERHPEVLGINPTEIE